MLIEIEKIKVKDRIRKDFGDMQELADDIKENGLINPPVITPDTYELIAGERRLRAMKLLGYQQIEVRPMSVKDAEHQLNLEISENETRKDFSKKERIEYAKRLRVIEELKAKGRMSDGGKGSQISVNLRTDDIVSEKLGCGSRDTLRKEEYIVENQSTLSPTDFADWDEGKLSSNKAFLKIKSQLQEKDNVIAGYELKLKTASSEQENKHRQQLQNLEAQIEVKDKKIATYESQKEMLERKASLNTDEAEKYKKLKSDIDFLSKQKNDLSRQISSATELAGLTVRIQKLLEEELAPIKFKRCMEVMDTSEVAVKNLKEVLASLNSWVNEINALIPNGNTITIENFKECEGE